MTNSQDNKIPNEYHACLFAILLNSVVKINNDYYWQILLEECKQKVKK